MTKTANENYILTRIDKQEKDHNDWTHSVTSTENGISLWEEVPVEDYLLWLKDHPQPIDEIEEQ